MKENKRGITLVALIITIIGLLILAGVTLNMVMGETGIISKAQIAKEQTRKSNIYETINLLVLEKKTNNIDKEEEIILNEINSSLEERMNSIGETISSIVSDSKIKATISNEYICIITVDGVKSLTKISGETIELEEGEIKIIPSTSDYTNRNIQVTIESNTDKITEGIIYYRTEEDSNWSIYTSAIELSTNEIILAKIEGLNGSSSIATLEISNIDKLVPISSTPTAISTTNKITVTANATDQEKTEDYANSGIAEYNFSINGGSWTGWQSSEIYEFKNLTQKTNYTIRVKAKDNAGNESEEIAIGKSTGEVPAIETGDIVFEISPTTYTNGNVTVTITLNKDITGYTMQYKTDSEVTSWTDYTEDITLTKNQTISVRVIDEDEQTTGDAASRQISIIDKLPPNSFTPSITTTESTVKIEASATDATATTENACSGIAEYSFSKDGGSTWTAYQSSGTYTFSSLSSGTTYTIKVKAKDNAGMETTTSNISATTKRTYTVTYNANGGSGAPSAQTKVEGTNLTLSSTEPTRSGYTFKGWGTSANTTTVSYAAGATYTRDAELNLYAVWESQNITFTNGYKLSDSGQSYSSETSATLPAGAIVTYKYSTSATYGGANIIVDENVVASSGSGTNGSGTKTYSTSVEKTVTFKITGGHVGSTMINGSIVYGSSSASLEIISIVDSNGNSINFE